MDKPDPYPIPDFISSITPDPPPLEGKNVAYTCGILFILIACIFATFLFDALVNAGGG